jgi:hypothetical protein
MNNFGTRIRKRRSLIALYKSMTTLIGCSAFNGVMKKLRVVFFALVASTLFLAGCVTSPPQGRQRYHVSSWAIGSESERSRGFFVVDTWTGEVWDNNGVRMEKVAETLRSRP